MKTGTINKMKYHILFALLGWFLFTVCFAENNIAKLYIDDGLLSYCQTSEELESAVRLYVMDLSSNEARRYYLPGSICAPAGMRGKSSVPVRFPLAWSVGEGNFRIIFPNLFSDAMGRISFRIWSAENIFDLQTQKTIKGFVDENQTMRYRGYWHGQPISFMNSIPFSTTSITNATNHLWYEVDREDILARIPLQTSKQEEWIPSNSSKLYRWVIYSIVNEHSVAAEDAQHNDFTPLTAIQTQGKKILRTNGSIISSENADWLIWGIDQQNKAKELRVFNSNKMMRLEMKDCSDLPKFILSNEDSDYILLAYDDTLKPSNVEDSLKNIVNYLKTNNLLKKYSRCPIVEQSNGTDEHQSSPALSGRGWFDSLPPEELERRKAEFLARQPKDNIFTEEEFKALFPKVDYNKITDLYERGMAYDWDEKFTDAMKCFEQYSSLKSNFMLAKYCKTGRVEISKDIAKSNSIFYEIISSINSKSGLPTPEELCLAGRACLEITPSSFTEKQALKKKAQSFFQEAVKQGYVKASYYSQYYNRLNSDFKPDELIKVANSNDLEAEALAAGMALLYNPAFKSYRSKAENLAIIKKAIQAHLPLAEYILGELFNQAGSRTDDALKPNPELAKFWLKRAANHGDPDAIDLLRQNPTLRPYNR